MGEPKQVDLAWVGGILDGEGCIYLNRCSAVSKAAKKIKASRFMLCVRVNMGHEATLHRCREITGYGTIYTHSAKSARLNVSYAWSVYARVAGRVLEMLDPHIFTLRDELQLAYDFLALPRAKPGGGKNWDSQERRDLQDARTKLYWKLRMAKPRWCFYRKLLKKAQWMEIARLGLVDPVP